MSTNIALPSALAAAVGEANAFEVAVERLIGAAANADDRVVRAQAGVIEAEAERDRIAAALDLTEAALALGEQPDEDPAALEKKLASAGKRVAADRAELAASESAARGLRARLATEERRRAEIAARLGEGMAEARAGLTRKIDLAMAEMARLIVERVGPLQRAAEELGILPGRGIARDLNLGVDADGRSRSMLVQRELMALPCPPAIREARLLQHRFERALEAPEAA